MLDNAEVVNAPGLDGSVNVSEGGFIAWLRSSLSIVNDSPGTEASMDCTSTASTYW